MCDAPCFTDRHVLREEDSNMFNSKRKQERIRLPTLQRDLLM